jgi:uncharacterized membrane protein YgcG
MIRNIFLGLIFLMTLSLTFAQPSEKDWVNDYTGLLNPQQKTILSAEMQALEDSVGSQLVVMVIDTLEGMDISEFSLLIANSWGIGRKDFDDGVLVVLSMKDRQMRIEVGLGLEKIISNETAEEIIVSEMIPEFREQKFFEGLLAAVNRIKTLILNNRELIGQKNYSDE